MGAIENFGSHFQDGLYGNGSIGDERPVGRNSRPSATNLPAASADEENSNAPRAEKARLRAWWLRGAI
ncbi:hypothetical protein GGD65_006301 [Bradyrhizobium sp. CIR18]|uniref:hypothetical protein n=1 Tax=Bradyrhizobium sp. CIR18 TaxID=2663839 RepID=UPI001790AB44|nr:hypothetical protein [Bradyrhizobium sp. CIR18]MBB4365235.1 hypothetical protein [Bradyrhizobium sp. CIR18]